MKLMPQPSFRWCTLPTCGKRWYTAYPHAQSCPHCGEKAKDATIGWPHACASGHAANHGGECGECVVEQRKKEQARPVVVAAEWSDR